MIRRRLCFLPVLALLVVSCAPKRSELLLNTDATSPAILLNRLEEREAKLTTLVGRGIVTFDSPEMAGSASFLSNMKKPDSLLVTLAGPFGIEVGTLFLSREKYVMYNSLENSVATGDPTGAALRSVIPFELTPEQILNAFAGVFSIPYSEKELLGYTIEDDMFFLTYSCGKNTCRYWIDPRYLVVSRFEQRDADGNLLVEARASSFTEQDDAVAARRIRITFPQQSRQLSIAYNSLTLNGGKTDFRFSIPSNAKPRFQ